MSADSPEGFITGPGDYFIQVVGESSYQDALEEICGGRTEDGADEFVDAFLIVEDTNPNVTMPVSMMGGVRIGPWTATGTCTA